MSHGPDWELRLAARQGRVVGVDLIVDELWGPASPRQPEANVATLVSRLQAGMLRRAWHVAAEGALHTGNPARAQVLAETAIAADPLDEAAYRVLMRSCAAAGEPARAIMTYQRLRGTLAAELGTDPAPVTRDLHVAILRANALTTPA